MARLVLIAVALGLLLAGCGGDDPAPTTEAEPAPARVDLAGGTTSLRLDPAVSGLLQAAGVRLEAIDPASRSGDVLRFPISSGEATLDPPAGEVAHEGGVRFAGAGTAGPAEATGLQLDLAAGTISAELAGERLTLFEVRLDPPAAGATRLTGGVRTPEGDELQRRLGVPLPLGGVAIGRLEVTAARP